MIPYAESMRYMIAGYAAIFIIIGFYLVSLIARWRRTRRDLETLESVKQRLDEEEKNK